MLQKKTGERERAKMIEFHQMISLSQFVVVNI